MQRTGQERQTLSHCFCLSCPVFFFFAVFSFLIALMAPVVRVRLRVQWRMSLKVNTYRQINSSDSCNHFTPCSPRPASMPYSGTALSWAFSSLWTRWTSLPVRWQRCPWKWRGINFTTWPAVVNVVYCWGGRDNSSPNPFQKKTPVLRRAFLCCEPSASSLHFQHWLPVCVVCDCDVFVVGELLFGWHLCSP